MKKTLFSLIFSIVVLNGLAQRDSFEVYFVLGKSDLSWSARDKIKNFVATVYPYFNGKISLLGYGDYLGSDSSNNVISQQRADSARAYFIRLGFNPGNIERVEGKGKIPRGDTAHLGYAFDRKVVVSYKKWGTSFTIDDFDLVQTGETFIMPVYFPAGKHFPLYNSEKQLQKLLMLMRNNKKMKIAIEGHICCGGDPGDDVDVDTQTKNLSVNRAKYVYDYLLSNGIDSSRASYAGYGFSRPVVYPEDFPGDTEKNRRVEIRILEK